MAVDPCVIVVDFSRDGLLNDFTLQTLRERYMLPGEESPQTAFARAAAAFADDADHAQRLYDYVSKLWFMFATPLLSNGGSARGLPISCFLTSVEDSRESILAHYTEVGWLSSVGGGIGGHWGDLRSNGEKTSHGSSSTGIVPFISVIDREIIAFSQGGTRRGSYAAYLDISHPEIEEFITMRKPTGGDQNRKGTNLHNAVNITDEFMIAVRDGLDFALRSPKTGETIKTVNARHLWRLLIETRMQTGEPYMLFIDTANRAMPESQKKLGLKVKQSNLCVAPYTELLTSTGFKPIAGLDGLEVEAWNGLTFSKVTVSKTSNEAELVRVWFEDGDYMDCTPEHVFYTAGGKVAAAALKNGTHLEDRMGHLHFDWRKSLDAPFTLADDAGTARSIAYTAGWASFAGFEDDGRLTIHTPPDVGDLSMHALLGPSVDSKADEDGMLIRYEPKSIPSGHVPFEFNMLERREWLSGAMDAVGSPITLDGIEYHVLGSTDVDMIREMRLLGVDLGLAPAVRLTDTMNAFMLDLSSMSALQDECQVFPKVSVVADVHPLPFKMATYCATEPKRGRLCFNGYVTGQCTEIMEPTGRDIFEMMRTAVCCLSSINAEKFDEWKDVLLFILDLTRMLDNALQNFIDNAPESLKNAIYSAMRERSIGLGLLGFQAYLQSKGISMESEEARAINLEMFQHIKRQADAASLLLGAERGEAPDMVGTGERFANKLAVAPNASSSILCGGTSPSIEPHRANAYLHKTLSGSFPVRNPHLVSALQVLGMDDDATWQSIVANEGSVQQLEIPEHVKNVFKTAPEIDQMALVRLAADRAPLICQGQSVNLFFEHDTDARAITEAHFRAWEWGVKSLYYLRSTTPKRAENTNKKVARIHLSTEEAPNVPEQECFACQG